MPKKPEPSEEDEDLIGGLVEVDETVELRNRLDDSRLDDISDLNIEGDESKEL